MYLFNLFIGLFKGTVHINNILVNVPDYFSTIVPGKMLQSQPKKEYKI